MGELNAEPGKELITKVAQDEYFKYLVEKEVETKTQEKLTAWWKRSGAIIGFVLSVLALFGVREYLSFKGLVDGIKQAQAEVEGTRHELELKLAETGDKVNRANALLDSAQSLNGVVTASVEASRQGIVASTALTDKSLGFLTDSRTLMEASRASVEQGQREMLEKVRAISSDMQDRVAKGLNDLRTTEQEMIRAQGQLDGIVEAKRQADEAFKDLKGKIDEAKAYTSLAAELNKAKTFSFFMLEEHDTTVVRIGDYQIAFTSKEIAESIDIEVQVHVAGKQTTIPSTQLASHLVRGSYFVINNTDGLMCEVNAIRFRHVGPDFVFLRIFAT